VVAAVVPLHLILERLEELQLLGLLYRQQVEMVGKKALQLVVVVVQVGQQLAVI
jgi:hypothetical protein